MMIYLYLMLTYLANIAIASSSLIAHTRPMSGKKMDLGPIGEHVATAVKRLREHRRLTYADLSRRLDDLGRPIPPLGIRRMEAGERRIDVDDLVALALVLEVGPLAILLPNEPSAVVPGGEEYPRHRIWEWGIGQWPLWGDMVTFVRDSDPVRWERIMGQRDSSDAMALKLAAGTSRYELESDLQGSVTSAADAGDTQGAD
jgi:transcriptional regulator with XRE-family HTH domain